MSRRVDLVSFAAGIAVIAMGALLLLDQEGVIALSLGLVGAVVAATAGLILVVSGLAEEADER